MTVILRSSFFVLHSSLFGSLEEARLMSRTTLCVATAAVLALLSIGVMALRHHVMGDEVRVPHGPGTWKVSLAVRGRSEGDARLLTLTPLDFGRQHVVRESCQSAEFLDASPDA